MNLCKRCERFARGEKAGAEVALALVFADIRGSTTVAENMTAQEYSELIDRFYMASADVLVSGEATVEKLAGDQVAALSVPGLVDGDYVDRAVDIAMRLMKAYGYGRPEGPCIKVGAGVHTGTAFVGMVGTSGRMTEFTSLGDAPNVTARLASLAGSGEVVLSEATVAAASAPVPPVYEVKEVSLKGKAEPMQVHIIKAA
jgi:adenylate cyclase